MKIPLRLFCIVKLLQGMGTVLKYGEYTQWESIRENWFFLCQWVLIAHDFLARGGSLCPTPILSDGTPFDLNLCMFVHAVTVSMSSHMLQS